MHDDRWSERTALLVMGLCAPLGCAAEDDVDARDMAGSPAAGADATSDVGGSVAEGGSGASPATPSGGATGFGGAPSHGGDPGAGGTAGFGAAAAGGSAGTPAAGGNGGAPVEGGGSGGVGSAGAPAGGHFESRPLVDPPTYMGSAAGSNGCTVPSPTLGFEPVDDSGAEHPLFLYFVGTTFSPSDTSARYDSLAARTVTEAMARRGFVALSVHYDNTINLSLDKLTCTYASSNPESLLAVACGLSQVSCDLGIATWGHSQGALMAHAASQFEPRVRAVWTTGYSGGSYPLPYDRLRVVNGEADTMNSSWSTIRDAAGFGAGECPDDGGSQCLRADGSGFLIVRAGDCVTSTADHCWFDRVACSDDNITLEPNWVDPTSDKAFSLESNADWVAETVARP